MRFHGKGDQACYPETAFSTVYAIQSSSWLYLPFMFLLAPGCMVLATQRIPHDIDDTLSSHPHSVNASGPVCNQVSRQTMDNMSRL